MFAWLMKRCARFAQHILRLLFLGWLLFYLLRRTGWFDGRLRAHAWCPAVQRLLHSAMHTVARLLLLHYCEGYIFVDRGILWGELYPSEGIANLEYYTLILGDLELYRYIYPIPLYRYNALYRYKPALVTSHLSSGIFERLLH